MDLYHRLLEIYGPRGWWPLPSRAGRDGRDERGYLPGGGPPSDRAGIFEISVGAVLTQGISWTNAERALLRLLENDFLDPRRIADCPPETLASLVRPAGYYNVKARKLIELSGFFLGLRPDGPGFRAPGRTDLLRVWGIGPETADCILTYAFGIPSFVIDEYTRRIFGRTGLADPKEPYEKLRTAVERGIPDSPAVYAEYHALIVEHGKLRCRTRPDCRPCPLLSCCEYGLSSLSYETARTKHDTSSLV